MRHKGGQTAQRGRIAFFPVAAAILVIILALGSCMSAGSSGAGYEGAAEERITPSAEALNEQEARRLEQAVALYEQAVEEEGYEDGIVLYRYAYALELLNGRDGRVERLYLRAWIALRNEYPEHPYLSRAEESLELSE